MWNPLHFAVYYQNLELIKFFILEMKVNLALTTPKPCMESEKDDNNVCHYDEDKIFLLQIAI